MLEKLSLLFVLGAIYRLPVFRVIDLELFDWMTLFACTLSETWVLDFSVVVLLNSLVLLAYKFPCVVNVLLLFNPNCWSVLMVTF